MAAQRRRIPYELLNAREWMTDDQGGLVHVDSDVEDLSNEDEWAEGSSSSKASAAGYAGRPAPQHALDHINENVTPRTELANSAQQASSDEYQGWATVSRKKTKLPSSQEYVRLKNQMTPKLQTRSQPAVSGKGASASHHKSKSQHMSKPQAVPGPRKFRRPIYQYDQDNVGRDSYRHRQPPNGKLTLNKDAIELEPDGRKLYVMLAEFGKRFRTFCCPPQQPQSREILIWGTSRDVDRTIDALKKWMSREENGPFENIKTSRAHENFAKAYSVDTAHHQRELKRLKREAALGVYLQKPDPNKNFPIHGWSLWTEDDLNPTEIFGNNMEAFDPIKRSCKCHVEFDEPARAFHILGEKQLHVNDALSRINVAVQGLITQTQSRKVTEFATDVRSIKCYRNSVVVDVKTFDDGKTCLFPKVTGNDYTTTKPWSGFEEAAYAHLEKRMTEGFEEALPPLPYFNGRLSMRITFGTLALTRFPKVEGSVGIQGFLDQMRRPGIKGEMLRDIPGLHHFHGKRSKMELAGDMLEPLSTSNTDLELVTPRIGGRFLIYRSDRPAVQYHVEWSQLDNEGHFFPNPGVWTRADRKDIDVPMQVCMLRLEGAVSWEFSVEKGHHLMPSQIDPKMSSFANGVSLVPVDVANLQHTGRKQIRYSTELGALKPSEFEQKTAYRYRLRAAPEWVVEFTRYDMYAPDRDFPQKTSWAVTMENTLWDAMTSVNQKISIGQCAHWSPTLDTFFPTAQKDAQRHLQGVTSFIQNVQKVAQFIDKLRTCGPGTQ